MGLRKGQTNNPNGRPKGKPNKSTEALRDTLTAFLHKNLPTIQKLFNELDAKDKLAFIDKILAYSLPKLQAVQMNADIDLNNISEEKLDSIIDKIMNNE